MSALIAVLPDHVANQIAAGEVVQRPASVVKELLENSIDAGATKITLHLDGAGRTRIAVSDNGSGMDKENAERCFLRHATSKIKSAEDLFNLHTRGFRGEAMASIAAVSHITLRTKSEDLTLGIELKLEGGSILGRAPYPMETGTFVEVKNLFYNVPARRKFLKNDRVELRHCIDEFQRVALVHTNIEWVMKSDGNTLFHLKPEALRRRINAIFGRKYDERLVPIEEETDVVRVVGFILKPEFAKKKRGEQFFFVNDRFIKSPYLHNALREAFEEVLTAEHHPGYFLHLTVDPQSLDVNIHPTKTEVKFEDERTIYAVLRSAARHAIGQFNVAPAIDFDSEISFNVPPMPKGTVPQQPKIQVNPHFNPFETTQASKPIFRSDDEKYKRIQDEKYLNAAQAFDAPDSPEVQWSLEDALPSEPVSGKIIKWGRYAITTLGQKALVIDIQRARFRILYDQIWSKLQDTTIPSQQVLFPKTISLSLTESALYQEREQDFAIAGYDLVPTKNPGVYEIQGIPMFLEMEAAVPSLEMLFEQYQELEEAEDQKLLRSMALAIASYGSRSQIPKTAEELYVLREQLLSSSNPQHTPKGKKIITEINPEDIENKL
jgi:DNA mismatch repair protein MutL